MIAKLHPGTADGRRPMRITRSVVERIARTIGDRAAEQGGPLGAKEGEDVVAFYDFDTTARRTGATYSPDVVTLNTVMKKVWNPRGVRLAGFVHSHPPGYPVPSGGDARYAKDILRAIPDLPELKLPIVQTRPDTGDFSIHAFAARRSGDDVKVEPLVIEIVEDRLAPTQASSDDEVSEDEPAYRRVTGAYDLKRLQRTRVLIVGSGGSAAFLEDMMRMGVGEVVLIDPDRVSIENVATQQAYWDEVGRRKVDVVAKRLARINRKARVLMLTKSLDDLSDVQIAELAHARLFGQTPELTMIAGFTDDFPAQARVNRIALNLGIPSINAQVYAEGRGGEVTFTYPGVTPACGRCVTRPRYVAYLQNGFRNDVTSNGCPIFATTRLNALKGPILAAMVHHGTSHPRWGTLLRRIGNRNLVQIRMDPDLALPVFEKTFGKGPKVLFDETVWLPQEPDCPEYGYPHCPDCGGLGDLRVCRGTFADTREMEI